MDTLTADLVRELSFAETIIATMLRNMPDAARIKVGNKLLEEGISPDGMTRWYERRQVLERAAARTMVREQPYQEVNNSQKVVICVDCKHFKQFHRGAPGKCIAPLMTSDDLVEGYPPLCKHARQGLDCGPKGKLFEIIRHPTSPTSPDAQDAPASTSPSRAFKNLASSDNAAINVTTTS